MAHWYVDPVFAGSPRRVRRWMPIFVGAVVARLCYWMLVRPHWVPDADADQYVQISRALAAGRGFSLVFPQLALHETAFRPPLYPFLLAPGAWVFGDALWPARLLNVLIGSAVAVLAGVLTARIGGRVAGLVAAGVVAVYPPLLANDTVTLTEPLALALLLGALLLIDARRWARAGVAVGLLLLTRPNGYLVLVILAAWLVVRLDLKRAAGFVAIALLVFFPWLVRNEIQVGTWRPTTSDGFTIAAMYAAPARAAGTFVDPVFSHAYDDTDHRFAQFDEALWNQKLTREGAKGAVENPWYVWRTVRRNFRGYFEINPPLNHYPEKNDGRDWRFRQDVLPCFYVVTIAGLVGLARRWRDARVVVLIATTAQFVALSLLLVAPPRLRAPFDLACCIGVGLLVDSIWSHAQRREPRRGEPRAIAAPQLARHARRVAFRCPSLAFTVKVATFMRRGWWSDSLGPWSVLFSPGQKKAYTSRRWPAASMKGDAPPGPASVDVLPSSGAPTVTREHAARGPRGQIA